MMDGETERGGRAIFAEVTEVSKKLLLTYSNPNIARGMADPRH